LIVEVLSPSTEAADRGAKFNSYRHFTTLQEYVLIQPEQPLVEVFTRNQAGKWVLSEYGMDDLIHLESIDCQIAMQDLYDRVSFEPIPADQDD
jgi:Uma2 family endonuclease